MNAKRILSYLQQLSANNNRTWFQEHREEYDAIRADFEHGIEQAIRRIATFDSTIAHLNVKDCTYRFYRDTRFSHDKSPYKNHLGAYISAHGKKALHGGYYIHLEPDHCMVACGNYWLPTNILTSCRNEIMANTDEWLRCVESPEFIKYYGANNNIRKSGEANNNIHQLGEDNPTSNPSSIPESEKAGGTGIKKSLPQPERAGGGLSQEQKAGEDLSLAQKAGEDLSQAQKAGEDLSQAQKAGEDLSLAQKAGEDLVPSWDQPQGFGLERLKTCPAGFPRDWDHVEYLRLKDYCCWHRVDDTFYQGDEWLDNIEPMLRAAKPMMDMMNAVIDDYE